MAKSKSRVSRGKKAKRSRRKNPNQLSLAVMKNFPERLKFLHTYWYRSSALGTGATAHGTNIWRANGVFDPDQTAGGLQPLNYDLMSGIYQRTKVLKCKVSATFYNNVNKPVIASLIYQGQSLVDMSNALVYDPSALPHSKSTTLAPAGIDGSLKTLVLELDLPKIIGVSYIDELYSAPYNGSPSYSLYFSTNACSTDGTAVNTLLCMTKIEYTVLWYDPYYPEMAALD